MKKFAVVTWPEHLKGRTVEVVNSPAEGVFNTTDIETGESRVIHADNLDLSATDHGYIALSKFSSARDDILHSLCVSEWSNASFGDVEAPTGYVWRISNTVNDVSRDNKEFASVIEDWFRDNEEVTDSPALRKELHGHFLITEDSQGFVTVEEFPTETALKNRFAHLEECFQTWSNEEEDEELYSFSGQQIEDATDAAMVCLLWQAGDITDEEGSSTGETWDGKYSVEDFAPGQREKMKELLTAFMNDEEETNLRDLHSTGATPEQIGHDYVLTTGGHGAGFWDRGYEEAGERLSEVCRAERAEWYLYVADDGSLHCGDLD